MGRPKKRWSNQLYVVFLGPKQTFFRLILTPAAGGGGDDDENQIYQYIKNSCNTKVF